jgi:hypothetical protein
MSTPPPQQVAASSPPAADANVQNKPDEKPKNKSMEEIVELEGEEYFNERSLCSGGDLPPPKPPACGCNPETKGFFVCLFSLPPVIASFC